MGFLGLATGKKLSLTQKINLGLALLLSTSILSTASAAGINSVNEYNKVLQEKEVQMQMVKEAGPKIKAEDYLVKKAQYPSEAEALAKIDFEKPMSKEQFKEALVALSAKQSLLLPGLTMFGFKSTQSYPEYVGIKESMKTGIGGDASSLSDVGMKGGQESQKVEPAALEDASPVPGSSFAGVIWTPSTQDSNSLKAPSDNPQMDKVFSVKNPVQANRIDREIMQTDQALSQVPDMDAKAVQVNQEHFQIQSEYFSNMLTGNKLDQLYGHYKQRFEHDQTYASQMFQWQLVKTQKSQIDQVQKDFKAFMPILKDKEAALSTYTSGLKGHSDYELFVKVQEYQKNIQGDYKDLISVMDHVMTAKADSAVKFKDPKQEAGLNTIYQNVAQAVKLNDLLSKDLPLPTKNLNDYNAQELEGFYYKLMDHFLEANNQLNTPEIIKFSNDKQGQDLHEKYASHMEDVVNEKMHINNLTNTPKEQYIKAITDALTTHAKFANSQFAKSKELVSALSQTAGMRIDMQHEKVANDYKQLPQIPEFNPSIQLKSVSEADSMLLQLNTNMLSSTHFQHFAQKAPGFQAFKQSYENQNTLNTHFASSSKMASNAIGKELKFDQLNVSSVLNKIKEQRLQSPQETGPVVNSSALKL